MSEDFVSHTNAKMSETSFVQRSSLTSSVTEPIVGFSPFALVVAIAVATAATFISSEISRRCGV